MGKLLAGWFLPLVTPHPYSDVQVGITFLLLCVNLAAALFCGLLLQQAIWKMTRRPWLSLAITAAFWGLGPLLSYSRTGTSYLPGLALTSLAIYLAAARPVVSWRLAVIVGLLAGFAALLWIPYILSIPAVLLASPIFNCYRESWKERLRFAAVVCVTAGVLIVAAYATAIAGRHISSWAEFRAWAAAGAEYTRSGLLLRFPGGFTRGFYLLGDDSVWFKWYLFRDPYARVGVMDLLGAMALSLALFYGSLAALIWFLWRSTFGRRLLLLTATLAIPHFALAIGFETGDPSRYVPLLTVLFAAFGYVVASRELGAGPRICLALLCCAPAVVNVTKVLASSSPVEEMRTKVAAQAPKASRFYVLNQRDSLLGSSYPGSFQPSIPSMPGIFTFAFTPTRNRVWRSDFACGVLATWDRGADVWITRRVLADIPIRDWKWVQGDVPEIPWQVLHLFFTGLDRGEERGGTDGFFALARTEKNASILEHHLPGGRRDSCPAPVSVGSSVHRD
jgi:hypothetical protein